MYVARHKVTNADHILNAKDKHEKVLKAVDSKGALVVQLQDLVQLQQGNVPNEPVVTEAVQVRQRYLPTAACLEEDKRPHVNSFLAARFLGKLPVQQLPWKCVVAGNCLSCEQSCSHQTQAIANNKIFQHRFHKACCLLQGCLP